MPETSLPDAENRPKAFGTLLLYLRTKHGRQFKRGFSQEKLGAEIVLSDGNNVGKNVISLWETCQAWPSLEEAGRIIKCIVDALKCTDEEKKRLKEAYIADLMRLSGLDQFE